METSELVICNVQANLRNYQDAPNFEASKMGTQTVDETDRNALSALLGSKFEHGLKHFPEINSFLMQVFSANTNSSLLQPVNNTYRDQVGSSIQHAKSKFNTQTIYVRSTFSPSATLPKLLHVQPPTEAMFIEMLRIVDIPADYKIHFEQPTVMCFESLAYTCTVSEAKNGYASSMITDLSAQQLSSPSKDTTVCTLKSSTLTRFYESSSFHSHTLMAPPTSISYHQNLGEFLLEVNYFASNLKKILLVYKKMLLEYSTSKLTKRDMIGFQMLSGWTSSYIDSINCWILLFEQESQNGQVPMLSLALATVATSCTAVSSSLSLQSCSTTWYMATGIPLRIKKLLLQAVDDELITTTTTTLMNDKEKIKVNSSLSFQCDYVIPSKRCPTSVVIPSQALVVQSLSDSNQLNKSTSGTSVYVAISRAAPSTDQVKVHSSLLLIPAVIPNKDYFERCFNTLLIVSHLSCIPLHPEQFEGLQWLSHSMQLQISTVSDLGMPEHCQNDLRGEAINGTPSHHVCRTSPPRRSSTLNKRSIRKRLVKKDRCGSLPKRCLHRPEHHYLYKKFLWSQLRGKKMNRISLRKGLMPYASTVHSSLKYRRTEIHSTESRHSLRLKQASLTCQPLEESRAFDRGVALFRGGTPSTQKSDTSATSSEDDSDSDTDGVHTGAETPVQNPTSSHETSHSNGAMNVRPSSEVPPPLETDRYVQSSESPAALVTKSSEQLLHSQGASNYFSEPPKNKQVPCTKSPSGSSGSQSFYVQPKLECYEDENIPPIRPQILEQAEEEVSPVLATGKNNERVPMRPRHDNNADLAQPQVPKIENHPPQSAVAVSCSIPLCDSITGPAILGFGANIEAAISSASALPDCQVQAVVNHENQLATVQRRLRGLVLQMRFRCDRISHLLQRSQNNLNNDQLQAIQLVLRDIVREMRCIAHQWHVCELRFQRIRTLSLHTNIRDRLFGLRQLRALHACHSLLRLQPRLKQINSVLLEILSQLQQTNAHAAAQVPHAPQANPQQAAVMLPALLPGPGNVMPFQAQVEEDNPVTHTDMHR